MQSWIWKIAGAAAAVATASAAVVLMEKVLEKRQEDIQKILDQNRLDEEDVTVTPECEQEVEHPQAQQPQPEEKPAEETSAQSAYAFTEHVVGEDTPNPNPVMAPPAETPRTADGKIDVSKLCDPADFCNWDDLGCQS